MVQECEHCHSFLDYALFAIPRPLLEYVRSAAVVGFVTMRETGREWARRWALCALVLAAAVEAYMLATVEVSIPREAKSAFMVRLSINCCTTRVLTARSVARPPLASAPALLPCPSSPPARPSRVMALTERSLRPSATRFTCRTDTKARASTQIHARRGCARPGATCSGGRVVGARAHGGAVGTGRPGGAGDG